MGVILWREVPLVNYDVAPAVNDRPEPASLLKEAGERISAAAPFTGLLDLAPSLAAGHMTAMIMGDVIAWPIGAEN